MIKEIIHALKVNRIFVMRIRAEKYEVAARIADKHMTKRQLIVLLILKK